MLVATYRPADVESQRHPLRAALASLGRGNLPWSEIAPAPFADGEVAAFLERELGAPPPPELVDFALRRTEGNPLFLLNVLNHLLQSGRRRARRRPRGARTFARLDGPNRARRDGGAHPRQGRAARRGRPAPAHRRERRGARVHRRGGGRAHRARRDGDRGASARPAVGPPPGRADRRRRARRRPHEPALPLRALALPARLLRRPGAEAPGRRNTCWPRRRSAACTPGGWRRCASPWRCTAS